MRTILLTSNSLRHKYIAAVLTRATDLALVVTEEKSQQITNTSEYSTEDADFLDHHFASRAASEKEFFGSYSQFPNGTPLLMLGHGEINATKVYDKISAVNPDLIILFGTSIIKGPFLKEFEGRIINLHLGLSPYYRGSATNLHPYLYEEPECVGATIHLATSKVDKGQILHQLRPEIQDTDSLHDIGNKTILQAGQILPKVLVKYVSGDLQPIPQSGRGHLTRNKDISPYVLRQIYRNFEKGMIEDYLSHKVKRDASRPLVEQV